ncbi:hypothetical protein MHYP_G00055000 [Metynnis hypsauchen]
MNVRDRRKSGIIQRVPPPESDICLSRWSVMLTESDMFTLAAALHSDSFPLVTGTAISRSLPPFILISFTEHRPVRWASLALLSSPLAVALETGLQANDHELPCRPCLKLTLASFRPITMSHTETNGFLALALLKPVVPDRPL